MTYQQAQDWIGKEVVYDNGKVIRTGKITKVEDGVVYVHLKGDVWSSSIVPEFLRLRRR